LTKCRCCSVCREKCNCTSCEGTHALTAVTRQVSTPLDNGSVSRLSMSQSSAVASMVYEEHCCRALVGDYGTYSDCAVEEVQNACRAGERNSQHGYVPHLSCLAFAICTRHTSGQQLHNVHPPYFPMNGRWRPQVLEQHIFPRRDPTTPLIWR
jgi:hypothetical protein